MNNVATPENVKRRFKLTNKHREWLTGYSFILFWAIGLIIFTLFPLFQAFWYSLNEAVFKGAGIQTTWNGLQNFVYAFREDGTFPTMLINYLSEVVLQVPFAVTAAMIIAMLLNQKIKMRGIWRVIFFLPVIISTGPVISELMGQGATSIPLLADGSIMEFISEYLPKFIATPLSRLFDKLIIVLWYSGIPILILLSGLQKIDRAIYEAAAIDGASPWQSFWKITLPSMKPFLLVSIIYMIVTLSFTGLPNADGTQTIIDYMQNHMLQVSGRGYGYACTLGIIYFLVIIIQIGIYALLLRNKKAK